MDLPMKAHLQVVCFGEVLWDILPDGPQPGGAPLNVAYHLNKLGIASGIISRIGRDENGTLLQQLMHKWKINHQFLQVDETYPTGEVQASLSNGNEVGYQIVFPAAWDFIEAHTAALEQVASAGYFIYGSLASRNEATQHSVQRFLELDVFRVLDINLRYPFVKRSILHDLITKADMVKLNEAELDVVQTVFGGNYGTERDKVEFIQDKFHIPEVLITKGEAGAAYYKGEERFYHYGSAVEVKDTIGSGDSFLAAFIAGHARGKHPHEILKNAITMGAFIATQKGACPDYRLEEYLRFDA